MTNDTASPGRPAAAVILAGGLSARMQGPLKPLLPLAGTTPLARLAATFRAAGLDDILVVGGHRQEDIAAEAAGLGLGFVANPDYASGMFSSVRAGLAAVRPDAARVLLTPADVPLFRPATVARLLERAGRPGAADVLYPTFAGERGHPPCLDTRLIPPILAHAGPGGLRQALAPYRFEEMPVADACILADMDTPADYAALTALARRLDVPSPAEAEALLAIESVPPQGLAHARGVAAVALALARALNAAGAALDCELVQSAALLHDVAKGRPGHEAAGGRLLDSLGFSRAAPIVASHRDIELPAEAPLTEREVVYLADKFVHGSRLVSVADRFGQKLAQFAGDDAATAAITRRRGNALTVLARVEQALPRPLARVLAETGLPREGQP
ncbi:DVU_1551 family NTP transferase [Solidesulfovibrio sp.]